MLITGVARLGRDGELRFLADGTPVINLAVAFNYGRKPQGGGDRPSQWLDLALFGKQAEALAPYLLKGNQISVTADGPHIETFNRNNGEVGSKLVATIINIELVGGRKDSDSRPAQQPAAQQPAQRPQAPSYDNFSEAYDDDIPFASLNWQIRAHLI